MPSGRILVVDDEANITSIIEEHFTSLGYVVDVAHDGAAALIQAAAVRPDVVLLDVTMPKISGDEVLDRLRAIDPTLPIVILTGNADESLARSFLRRGALDYVGKQKKKNAANAKVTSAVSIGPREGGGFGIAVKMRVEDRSIPKAELEALVREAHEKICPYSHATRGNVDVTFEVIGS
jgi:CheY-like chemotaxis protein